MKNVKLFLSTVVVFLALGTSTVNAQQKQSVIITELYLYNNITMEVVKPDYSIDKKEYSIKEENPSVVLKKELDKWIEQGYEVTESSMATTYNNYYRIIYFLTKKD